MNRIATVMSAPQKPTRTDRTRWVGLQIAGVVACIFLTVVARPALAQVHDNAGKFSKEAVEQADQTIKEIKDKHRHELLLETYSAIPDSMQSDFQTKGKDRFFADWAEDRRKAEGVDGVVVLICMDPRRLEIVVGNETRKKLFTSADRQELQQHLTDALKGDKYDEGLTKTASFVLKKFNEHDPRDTGATNSGVGMGNNAPTYTSPPSSSPPTGYSYNTTPRSTDCGAGGIEMFVCLIVGAVILIALLRLVFRNSGGGFSGGMGGGYGGQYGSPPPPQGGYGGGYAGGYGPGYAPPSRGSGFGSGLLGGLLGGAVGGYAADRLMHHNDGTSPPPAGGGGYAPQPSSDSGGTFTPDTSSSGGGSDFGSSSDSSSSSGSDFGSSDSGGGGSDFGGGGGGDSGSSGGSDF